MNASAGCIALLASLLAVGVPVYVLLLSEFSPIPTWLRVTAIFVAIPVFKGVRGWFMELLAKRLVAY